jgi:hypothetical protein
MVLLDLMLFCRSSFDWACAWHWDWERPLLLALLKGRARGSRVEFRE